MNTGGVVGEIIREVVDIDLGGLGGSHGGRVLGEDGLEEGEGLGEGLKEGEYGIEKRLRNATGSLSRPRLVFIYQIEDADSFLFRAMAFCEPCL